jgi:hypothetical protein
MIMTGESQRTRRQTCPSATLSTTNPTWTDPGTNLGLHGERPATNCLTHGMVFTHKVEREKIKITLSYKSSEFNPLMLSGNYM